MMGERYSGPPYTHAETAASGCDCPDPDAVRELVEAVRRVAARMVEYSEHIEDGDVSEAVGEDGNHLINVLAQFEEAGHGG